MEMSIARRNDLPVLSSWSTASLQSDLRFPGPISRYILQEKVSGAELTCAWQGVALAHPLMPMMKSC